MTPATRFLFAADLDGTLLPNTAQPPPRGCVRRTQQMLADLLRADCPVCFISGRHLALARQAQRAYRLPAPGYWVCNVGTEIYSRRGVLDETWDDILGPAFDHARMWSLMRDLNTLSPQERVKQGPHKFSLYGDAPADAELIDAILERLTETGLELRIVASVEEATGRGLIDILPAAAGKASALRHLARRDDFDEARVFFAGDSGNDLDALVSGVAGTLVGNAPEKVREEALALAARHPKARLHLSRAPYGDGVIEGLRHFELVEQEG